MISLKKILSEVGEGSAKPFSYNRKGNFSSFFKSLKTASTIDKYTKQKDFVYEVIGDKTRYLVKFVCILREKNPMVLYLPGFNKKPKPPKDKYEMEVSVGFNVKRARDEYDTGLGEMYRLMATVIETMKDFVNGVDDDIKINSFHIYPKADDAPTGAASVDSKRGRIYLSYVKKNIGKLPGKWSAVQYNDRIEVRNGDWTGNDIIAKS